MSSKIIKAVLISLFSLSLVTTANAGLIVGDLYADAHNQQWEYVGSYDLADGMDYNDGATPLNAIEAAELNFGQLDNGQSYALSSNKVDSYNNIENFIVNHNAWYDAFDFNIGIHEANELIQANNSGDATYDSVGDVSAFIYDRAWHGENINHVFKSVAAPVTIPEPSILFVFLLSLLVLMIPRLSK